MPTRAGIPLSDLVSTPMLPAGPLNPVDWIDLGGEEILGAQQSALMRGTPGALTPWQKRQIPGPATVPQAAPWFFHSRGYDRGAGAFAPQFGLLPISPIGAGIYAPYKLPVIAGPGARYAFGAIFFDVQTIPTSIHAGPTTSMQSIDALLATSSVAAMYATTG